MPPKALCYPARSRDNKNIISYATLDVASNCYTNSCCTIASKISVTPKRVRFSEKLDSTAALCNEI